jgi:hypothetical protein
MEEMADSLVAEVAEEQGWAAIQHLEQAQQHAAEKAGMVQTALSFSLGTSKHYGRINISNCWI